MRAPEAEEPEAGVEQQRECQLRDEPAAARSARSGSRFAGTRTTSRGRGRHGRSCRHRRTAGSCGDSPSSSSTTTSRTRARAEPTSAGRSRAAKARGTRRRRASRVFGVTPAFSAEPTVASDWGLGRSHSVSLYRNFLTLLAHLDRAVGIGFDLLHEAREGDLPFRGVGQVLRVGCCHRRIVGQSDEVRVVLELTFDGRQLVESVFFAFRCTAVFVGSRSNSDCWAGTPQPMPARSRAGLPPMYHSNTVPGRVGILRSRADDPPGRRDRGVDVLAFLPPRRREQPRVRGSRPAGVADLPEEPVAVLGHRDLAGDEAGARPAVRVRVLRAEVESSAASSGRSTGSLHRGRVVGEVASARSRLG